MLQFKGPPSYRPLHKNTYIYSDYAKIPLPLRTISQILRFTDEILYPPPATAAPLDFRGPNGRAERSPISRDCGTNCKLGALISVDIGFNQIPTA